MVRLTTRIGKTTLEIEAPDMKTVCKASALIGAIPDKCGLCQSDEIHLTHKAPGGNDYYGVRCKKCGAEQNFHQRKEGGFYITAGDKFSIYDPDKAKADSPPPEDLY